MLRGHPWISAPRLNLLSRGPARSPRQTMYVRAAKAISLHGRECTHSQRPTGRAFSQHRRWHYYAALSATPQACRSLPVPLSHEPVRIRLDSDASSQTCRRVLHRHHWRLPATACPRSIHRLEERTQGWNITPLPSHPVAHIVSCRTRDPLCFGDGRQRPAESTPHKMQAATDGARTDRFRDLVVQG
jgi:hypothetical protein